MTRSNILVQLQVEKPKGKKKVPRQDELEGVAGEKRREWLSRPRWIDLALSDKMKIPEGDAVLDLDWLNAIPGLQDGDVVRVIRLDTTYEPCPVYGEVSHAVQVSNMPPPRPLGHDDEALDDEEE